MDKIVIFDWGGVVESHENNFQDINNAIVRLIKNFNKGLSKEEIISKWTDETTKGDCIGYINDEESIRDWVDLIQKNMNIDVPFEEFKIKYEEEFSKVKYYKEVVEYAHSLKDKCKIGILSNLHPFDKKRIDEQYNLDMFDYVFLSFEIGMLKPDHKVYQYVINKLKVDPKNILFIDDDCKNIFGAKECGLNTCQAFGYELDKIKKAVDKFLNNEWELTLNEDFKNLNNWNFEHGFIRNNELQYYTDKNYILDENGLTIVGKKEQLKNEQYDPNSNDWRFNREYSEVTSTSITTQNKFNFKNGYIEAKIKMPIGKGTWPAFWLLGSNKSWPDGGEIDIMEYLGRTKDIVYHNAHSKNHICKPYNAFEEKISNTTIEYHTYGLYKDEDILEFYVDRKLYGRLVRKIDYDLTNDWPFNGEFYIILNLALGGTWAEELDMDSLPAYYNVSYIKVWEEC